VPERFVSLAVLLERSLSGARGTELPAEPVETRTPAERVEPAATGEPDDERVALCSELARLRVAALEAYERAAASVLEGLAREVLARELRLAPPELHALLSSALAELAERDVVGLVVSAADAALLARRAPLPLATRVDPALGPGDCVLEVSDGSFESTLALRLSTVVEAAWAD
jgi:flagellar biosynthesis/type III secretory pathway protein FliH